MDQGKKINHWCVLCGTGYHACDTCDKEKNFTPWRTLTDTIEHYKIFTILKDYNNHLINSEQAKELLSKLDLSGKDNYKESAKKVLNDIYNTSFTNNVSVDSVPKKRTRKSTNNMPNEDITKEASLISEE